MYDDGSDVENGKILTKVVPHVPMKVENVV